MPRLQVDEEPEADIPKGLVQEYRPARPVEVRPGLQFFAVGMILPKSWYPKSGHVKSWGSVLWLVKPEGKTEFWTRCLCLAVKSLPPSPVTVEPTGQLALTCPT